MRRLFFISFVLINLLLHCDWLPLQEMYPTDNPGDTFGYDVAIDGNYAIIGTDETITSINNGSAYIFLKAGTTWTQLQKLTPTDAIDQHFFGRSVDISGDYAIVGARGDDDNGDGAGAAYLYRNVGATWSFVQKLTASDGAAGDYFGCDVAIDGDYAVVGAKGCGTGAAYVFKRNINTWSQIEKLEAFNSSNSMSFGTSVDIDSTLIAVGDPDGVYTLGNDSVYGSVSLFRFYNLSSLSFLEIARPLIHDNTRDFGASVAVYDDQVLIGAPTGNINGSMSGEAFVYYYSNYFDRWFLTQSICPADNAAGDCFGGYVALNGDTAVIGARYADVGTETSVGAAYVYVADGYDWNQAQKITPTSPSGGEHFGKSVAVSDNDVFIASANEYNSIPNTSTVHVFGTFAIPSATLNVFPVHMSTDMPRQVTVNWRYAGENTPTGFKVYCDGNLVADVPYTTDKLYSQALPIREYGRIIEWKVIAYNAYGDNQYPLTSSYTVMDDPGADAAQEPSEVVYNQLENVDSTTPPTLTMPAIDFGEGDIQPTLNFVFASVPAISTIPVQVMDQPSNPLPQPENCEASFSAFYPTGNQTTTTFYFSNTTSPNELVYWNGSDWSDVSVSSGADFSTPGQVTFTWTSSARGTEEFAVNGGGDSTLPVELSSFNAVQTGSDFAQLNWTTQSENNNLGFNILRSNYQDVAEAVKVNGDIIAGTNTSAEHTYSFTDEDIEYETEYFYWLESLDFNNNSKYFGPVSITIERDKEDDTPDVAIASGIHRIYPNPFNPRTTIEYSIYEDGDVMISVYNIKGQLIRTFNEGFKEANKIEEVVWDGKDSNSGNVSSGVYFIRIESGNTVETRKAVLLK